MTDEQFHMAMAEIRRTSNQLFFVIALSIFLTTLICTIIASKFYEEGTSITIESETVDGDLHDRRPVLQNAEGSCQVFEHAVF